MIHCEQLESNLLHLRLDDPARRNALGDADYDELTKAFQAAADPAIAAVLLSSTGPVFCAGNNREEFATHWPQPPLGPVYRFLSALHACPCPVVASVQGAGVGIGATLLLHCDAILMARSAWLCYPFAGLGITVEGGASQLLPARLGMARAMQILLSGRRVPAEEAVRLGLATQLVDGDPWEAALAEARHIATLNMDVVRAMKRQVRDAQGGDFPARFEGEIALIGRCMLAARAAEGDGTGQSGKRDPSGNRGQDGRHGRA